MSPFEKEIIKRKLAVIIENLRALEPICALTEDEYIEEIYKRKATERLLQEIVEAAIDINTHITVQKGSAIPDDYYHSFIKIGELKIISSELSENLAPSAGLRNRLVHEYDLLNHTIILDSVKMAIEIYPEYVKQIEEYLSSI